MGVKGLIIKMQQVGHGRNYWLLVHKRGFYLLQRLTSKKRKRRRLAVPSEECNTTGDLLMLLLDLEKEGDLIQMHPEVLKLSELQSCKWCFLFNKILLYHNSALVCFVLVILYMKQQSKFAGKIFLNNVREYIFKEACVFTYLINLTSILSSAWVQVFTKYLDTS